MAEGERTSTAGLGTDEAKEFLPGFASLEDYSKVIFISNALYTLQTALGVDCMRFVFHAYALCRRF